MAQPGARPRTPQEARNVSNFTASLNEAHSAYLDARGWALGASDRQIARRVRRLEHRKDRGRIEGWDLARLTAMRHVQADRT